MDLTRLMDSEIANVTENLFNSDSGEDEDPDLTEDEEEPIPAEKPPASPVKEGPHVPPLSESNNCLMIRIPMRKLTLT